MDKVIIYTDGGADPNPGIGGWAAILQYGEREKVLTGNEPHTTNNRMELMAAIQALQALKRSCQVEFYTDSEYLQRGITEWIGKWAEKGWVRQGNKVLPNAELWQLLAELVKKHEIEWQWVRGHAGNPLNERTDQLARQARLAITPHLELEATIPRLYVRSSCKGNPGPGRWGALWVEGENMIEKSGGEEYTTNNRMEILGAIKGLEGVNAGTTLYLITTSDYLFQGATQWINGWRKNQWHKKDGTPIANTELWQQLDQQISSYTIHWINSKGDSPTHASYLNHAAQLAQIF